MRLLLLTERPYLPQQIGGREMVIHETAEALLESGHQPIVMSSLDSGNWMFFKNRLRSKISGAEYPLDHLMGYPVYRGWDWQRGLGDVVRKSRPDMAIVESTALKYLDALGKLGIPAALRLHDTALHTLGGDPGAYRTDQFIAVSSYLADRFFQKYGFHPAVLPPLVHKERCATPTTRNKVVFVNPRPVKGGDLAIAIARACPDIPFLFFQAWTEDEQVKALKEQARALPNIEWRPSVMDAREIYKEAHTVLIPSQADETWGRMATEAHFNGIPVIASRRGGLLESVGPGGILLDPKSAAEEWIQTMRRLWDDPAHYQSLCRAALDYSRRDEIAAPSIMNKLLGILQGVAAGAPAPVA